MNKAVLKLLQGESNFLNFFIFQIMITIAVFYWADVIWHCPGNTTTVKKTFKNVSEWLGFSLN